MLAAHLSRRLKAGEAAFGLLPILPALILPDFLYYFFFACAEQGERLGLAPCKTTTGLAAGDALPQFLLVQEVPPALVLQ